MSSGVHDLDIWDDRPGADWTTSYMLGNGHLGAIVGMGTSQVGGGEVAKTRGRAYTTVWVQARLF